jgi:hypothetical protein
MLFFCAASNHDDAVAVVVFLESTKLRIMLTMTPTKTLANCALWTARDDDDDDDMLYTFIQYRQGCLQTMASTTMTTTTTSTQNAASNNSNKTF